MKPHSKFYLVLSGRVLVPLNVGSKHCIYLQSLWCVVSSRRQPAFTFSVGKWWQNVIAIKILEKTTPLLFVQTLRRSLTRAANRSGFDTNNPHNQSKLEAHKCRQRQARENVCERVTDWLRKGPTDFKLITTCSNVKPKHMRDTFDTWVKTALD